MVSKYTDLHIKLVNHQYYKIYNLWTYISKIFGDITGPDIKTWMDSAIRKKNAVVIICVVCSIFNMEGNTLFENSVPDGVHIFEEN